MWWCMGLPGQLRATKLGMTHTSGLGVVEGNEASCRKRHQSALLRSNYNVVKKPTVNVNQITLE